MRASAERMRGRFVAARQTAAVLRDTTEAVRQANEPLRHAMERLRVEQEALRARADEVLRDAVAASDPGTAARRAATPRPSG